jgi:heme exporter protein D
MNAKQAKAIPLGDILARLGHTPHHAANGEWWYFSPLRAESEPSFSWKEAGNVWFDFGHGGGNVIDFLLAYYRTNSVSDVLHTLDALMGASPPHAAAQTSVPLPLFPDLAPRPVAPQQPTPVTMPTDKAQESAFSDVTQHPLQHPALIRYVEKRGIPADLARPFVRELHYTREGRRYFAIGFPNRSGGFELRNAYFKGCTEHKDISLVAGTNDKAVAVFEGFFDFLAWLAYEGVAMPPLTALVLNSVALRGKALDTLIDRGTREARLYLDNDPAGKRLAEAMQGQLQAAGIAVTNHADLYDGHKDLSAFWEARCTQAGLTPHV